MLQPDKTALKKNIALSALGMGLQLMGSVCLFAATLGVVKEVNLQIKKAIIQELSKQVADS